MGKTARKRRSSVKEAIQQRPTRAIPNWPLLGLALIGMTLTSYLTMTTWAGQAVAGCPAGSGCDVVLNSLWSRLFGIPISLWGFLTYASLGGIALIKRADIHWKLAWVVSLFGVFYSLYLTFVSWIELEAACPYCLTSLVLMLLILGTVAYGWPTNLPGFSWRGWILKTVAGAFIVVLAIHFNYAGIWGKAEEGEDPRLRALAEHLTQSGAKFYGTYWCPHCNDQKELFGASAHRLPYVECSPGGRSAPQAAICNAAGVRVYPTWFIRGQRYEGVLSLKQLAEATGFKGDF